MQKAEQAARTTGRGSLIERNSSLSKHRAFRINAQPVASLSNPVSPAAVKI